MSKLKIYIGSDFHASALKPKARKEINEEAWVDYQVNILKQISKIVGSSLYLDCGDMINVGKGYKSQLIVNMLNDHSPENTVFISGNHCQYGFSQNLKHALAEGTLGNLARSSKLTYLEDGSSFEWGKFVIHPFNFHAGKTIDHREVDKAKCNIAVGHFLSYNADELPFFIGASKGWLVKDIITEYPEYDLIAVGDNHESFNVGNQYLSPGSLLRRKADQIKHKPCIWEYDGETLKPVYLDVPAFDEVLTREHLDEAATIAKSKEAFVTSVEALDSLKDLSLDIKDGFHAYFNSGVSPRPNAEHLLQEFIDKIEGAKDGKG
jgi:hypothetical protein